MGIGMLLNAAEQNYKSFLLNQFSNDALEAACYIRGLQLLKGKVSFISSVYGKTLVSGIYLDGAETVLLTSSFLQNTDLGKKLTYEQLITLILQGDPNDEDDRKKPKEWKPLDAEDCLLSEDEQKKVFGALKKYSMDDEYEVHLIELNKLKDTEKIQLKKKFGKKYPNMDLNDGVKTFPKEVIEYLIELKSGGSVK